MYPDRSLAKRCIALWMLPQAQEEKSFRERVGDYWRGVIDSLTVEIDGRWSVTLYVESEGEPLILDLDENAHVIRLIHSRLKPNYPTVHVPADRRYYGYAIDGSQHFRIECVKNYPALPQVNYMASRTTRRILDYLLQGLSPGGALLQQLRNGSVWSMELWCHESGFDLTFYPNGDRMPPEPIRYSYDRFSVDTDKSCYSMLPTNNAVGLERYLIGQLKSRLPNAGDLEFDLDDQFYYIRRKAKVAGSLTTKYICEDMVDYWRPGRWLYDTLHRSEVSEAIMTISGDGVYVRFCGYSGDSRRLPVDAELPYTHFHRPGGSDYHALTWAELLELDKHIVAALERGCGDILLRPVPDWPCNYRVIDLRKYENT